MAAALDRTRTYVVTTREAVEARHVAGALALVAGILTFAIGHDLFPYLSYNHDEAVYLQQAAMLLDGKLALRPPVVEPFRPWFFVEDGARLYPKYAPVPAAMFAVGQLLGSARLALSLITAGVIGLTYATVAEAFDRRTGLLAAALLLATPLFLVQASVFLPYVPTLFWLLLFAWAYLRADRTGDARWAALAGLGVAIAFFARPYTAVLFAAPFVAHACWTIWDAGRPALRRQLLTAAVGLLGVGLALGYNAIVTGDPLVFPYQAFAPHDGPGFGYRSLWGHGLEFTPALSIEATRIALTAYVLEWSVAPPLGVIAGAVGLGLVARRGRQADPRRLALGGLAGSVILGHLYFWGTLNAIGNLAAPGFGLMGHLGPYYHLALVVPTVAFGAHAIIRGAQILWPRLRAIDGTQTLAATGAVLVVVAAIVAILTVGAIGDALGDNREVTRSYEQAYEPIETAQFEDALVFLPTPHGPWLAHPFQYLHNGASLDGPVVYSQDRQVFAVLDAFPDRTPYRYSYRGEWAPVAGSAVEPRLQRLETVAGDAVRLDLTAGLPPAASGVVVRAESDTGSAVSEQVIPTGESLGLTVSVADGRAVVDGPAVEQPLSVPISGRETVDLTLFVDARGLSTFEYDVALPVEQTNGTVRAITPRQRVCSDVRHCDEGGAYVPGTHRPGISLETGLSTVETNATAAE